MEKLVHWTDPDGIGEAMDDLLEGCALIEVVCKDLGYADSEPTALPIKDLREEEENA